MANQPTTANNPRRPTANPLEQYGTRNQSTTNNGGALMSAAPPSLDAELLPAGSETEAFERVQLDVQIATAKRWPRPAPREIIAEMVTYATIDEETATSCFYTFEHEDDDGSKKIQYGPSVRLAEIAAVCYRNIRAGARVISNNGLMIQSQGFAFDLERNVATAIAADRQIATRKFENGRETYRTWSLDMQMKTGNAANAFAYRNNIFKVIPAVLIRPVLDACKKMAAGEGPIEERWTRAVKSFRPFGVNEEQLKTLIGKTGVPTGQLEDDDIAALRGFFTRLRDAETTVQDLFGGIDKDGTDRRNSATGEPAAVAATTPTATTEQRGAPGNTKGPLSEAMFTPEEFAALLQVSTNRQLVKNKAQLVGWLSRWSGTKDEAVEHIAAMAKPAQPDGGK